MHCIKEHVRRRRATQEKLCASCVTSKAGNPTVFSRRPLASSHQRHYLPLESERKKATTLTLSTADASPPYGFMLLPGTISSGFAMKRFSFASSQMKSAPFIALE